MAGPFASKVLIDTVYPARDVQLMFVVVLGTAVLSLSSTLMGAVRGYFAATVGSEITTVTSLGFFNHLQHLPPAFFDTHQIGEVLSRLSDVRGGIGSVTGTVQMLISSGVYLLVVPPFLIILNWKLTALSLLVIPITIAVSILGARRIRVIARESAETGAQLQAYQVEVLAHIGTLKSMAMESHVFARQSDLMHRVLRLTLRSVRAQTIVGVINSIVRTFGVAVTTWYAWTMILRGELSLGSYVAFSAYLGYLTGPAAQLAALFTSLQTAGITLGRMFEYLDMPVEQDPATAFHPLPQVRQVVQGDVAFRGVSFHYHESAPVLRDVDACFAPGTLTAIVGPSGAGKSTLLRMIARLVEPTSGEILVDGKPLAEFPLPEIRRQVACVWQQFSLMNGTVLDNLTMGSPDASRASAKRAIDVCCLDDFVSKLPRGLDTPLGEWGATLSEGQRQRIAIARALVRDTPILLLDEVTSNLDPATEELLLDRLLSAHRGKTIAIVTHRQATASRADVILTLADGRLFVDGESVSRAGGLLVDSSSSTKRA